MLRQSYRWILLTGGFLLEPSSMSSADFLPLTLGANWLYVGGAQFERMDVEDIGELWGQVVFVIRHSALNVGLENYWTTAPGGGVDLWGFWREVEGFGYLYRPPIRLLDAPPYSGKEWSSTFSLYALPETTFVGMYEVSFRVNDEGWIEVPAGWFYSFGIGPPNLPEGFPILQSLTGSDPDPGRGIITDLWSDGTGRVRYSTSQDFELFSYDLPVSTRPSSWGVVKALYGRP